MKSPKKLFRSLWLTFTSVLLVILSPASVLAQDITFYGTNDIIYYDPDACSVDGSVVGNGTVGSHNNPVYDGSSPDPSVIYGDDGKFHVFATGDVHLTSTDMSHWDKDPKGWNMKGAPNEAGGAKWGPNVVKMGSKYVLTYVIPTGTPEIGGGGHPSIAYATSDSLSGPFTYQEKLPLPDSFTIDPQIFNDDNGKSYFIWGGGYFKMRQVELNGDKLKLSGPTKQLLTKAGVGSPNATIESPWIYKHNGWYYLMYSQGHWDINNDHAHYPYQVAVARSKSAMGPYKPDNSMKIILKGNSVAQNPGTNSVITDSSGTDWIVYSGYKGNEKNTRSLFIDKIDYQNDWPVINGGNGPSGGQQAGSSGSGSSSTNTSSGGQVNITLAQANVQSQHGPGANYSQGQRARLVGTLDKFTASNPDFITLNEIAPDTNSNVGKYKSFKQDYPNAKTSEDSALRILWDSDRWKKVDGGIELIYEYNDPHNGTKPMNWKDRYALWATFQNTNNGATASVIATHWNTRATFHHGRAKEQGEKIKALTEKLLPSGPVLVAGDLNYQNTNSNINQPWSPDTVLGSDLTSVFKPGEGTVVDWMFYSSQLTNTSKKVIPRDSSLSDHPFIIGKFEGTGGSGVATSSGGGCCSASSGSDSATAPNVGSIAPGQGAPNGLTYPNLKGQKMVDAINMFIKKHQPNSPLKGTAQFAVASGKQANVSPFLAYAQALKESSLAVWSGPSTFKEANNAFGRMATSSQPGINYGNRRAYKWSSFEASLNYKAPENKTTIGGTNDYFGYLRRVYPNEINQGVRAFIMKYAPPNENDTETYINQYQGFINEMATYAGAANLPLNPSDSESTDTSTESPDSTASCATDTSSEDTSSIGVGQGKFTDKGSVNGADIIKANATLADRVLGNTWYKKRVCASIVARVISGHSWGYHDGTANPNGMLRQYKNSPKLHKDRNVPVGAILLYGDYGTSSDGHTTVYLGNNKILNDGVIKDASDAEGWGGGYAGWVDPNQVGFTPKKATESNMQALKRSSSTTW